MQRIIVFASHRRDKERFVMGPLTLGAGALCSLVLFSGQVASIAIYALALGDGLAGLVGRALGRLRPRFLLGKSLEGSAACFLMVLATSFLVTRDIKTALLCAGVGTVAEALPIEDFDNILLPVSVGFTAALSLGTG